MNKKTTGQQDNGQPTYLGIDQEHLLYSRGGLAHGVLVQHAECRHSAKALDEAAPQHRHGEQGLLAALSAPSLPPCLAEAPCL